MQILHPKLYEAVLTFDYNIKFILCKLSGSFFCMTPNKKKGNEIQGLKKIQRKQ